TTRALRLLFEPFEEGRPRDNVPHLARLWVAYERHSSTLLLVARFLEALGDFDDHLGQMLVAWSHTPRRPYRVHLDARDAPSTPLKFIIVNGLARFDEAQTVDLGFTEAWAHEGSLELHGVGLRGS